MSERMAAAYDAWLDLVADLVRDRDRGFPKAVVAGRLHETFGCVVSWNWMDDGRFGTELHDGPPGFPGPAELERWADVTSSHPLVCWYGRSGDPTPTTIGRVPPALVPAGGHELVRELLGPHGFEEQLAIPYVLGPRRYRTFVLARGRDDFTDQEVDLARRIQPLLAVLERQATAHTAASAPVDTAGLTARELAVLALLRDGLTAEGIGRRLLVSPRTVHSHLGSIYRKLGVTDRMRAVLVAQDLGLVPQLRPGHPSPDGPALAHAWVSPPTTRLQFWQPVQPVHEAVATASVTPQPA